MVNQQLIDYIKNQLKLGRSEDIIKTMLKNASWQEADIEEGFNIFYKTQQITNEKKQENIEFDKKPDIGNHSTIFINSNIFKKSSILFKVYGGFLLFYAIIKLFFVIKTHIETNFLLFHLENLPFQIFYISLLVFLVIGILNFKKWIIPLIVGLLLILSPQFYLLPIMFMQISTIESLNNHVLFLLFQMVLGFILIVFTIFSLIIVLKYRSQFSGNYINYPLFIFLISLLIIAEVIIPIFLQLPLNPY